MKESVCIGLTTLDKKTDANELAFQLVQQKLVACAQVEGPLKSFYHWQGALQEETEYRVVLKFPTPQTATVTQALQKLHPYENPQWIVLESTDTLPAYAQWVHDSIRTGSSH